MTKISRTYADQRVIEWFKDHPAVSVRQIESIAGMPSSTLAKYLKGERGLPKRHHESLMQVITNYGFEQ